MKHTEPFHFRTERRLVQLTGRSARTLHELLAALREVPGSCIFYHTHHLFLSHHFEKPIVYNEFANWVSEALREEALSEKLAAIDLMAFTSIRELREAIVGLIEGSLAMNSGRPRECPAGDEFHFCRSKSFVMATGVTAEDVPAFFRRLPAVTHVSLYFHFLEARLRLERKTNDFSQWLQWRGEVELAESIDRLDPYVVTLDELKEQIVELGRSRGIN
ncbi:MAG: hypothetical protein HY821_22330 [Acidobacteria bacterium]|nr:hypothetical protein [Acidobacteriota bacterium]